MEGSTSEEQTLSDLEDERIWNEERRKLHEELAKAAQVWGFERLDQIADYFSKHTDRLNKVFPNWGASIERYRNFKPDAEKQLAEITNDHRRYEFLLQQARMVTQLYPQEIKRIRFAEERSGRFPYLDSLMDTVVKMYRVPISNGNPYGRDETTESGYDRLYFLRDLTFGAKTTNETSGVFKRKIHPLRF